MVEDRFPDFELKIGGQVLSFEITMVTRPDRKMGKEAQARERAIEEFKETGDSSRLPRKPYRPGLGEEEGPAWVAEGVAKKVAKGYAPKPHLLVYANFDANDLDPQDLMHRCEAYSQSFASIWIIHAERSLLLYASEHFGCQAGEWYKRAKGPKGGDRRDVDVD